MACETCGHDPAEAASEMKSLEGRIEELEKALDDVLGEINNARADLNDAEKIVGKYT